MLADSQWGVLAASSGREALDILDRQPVSLVLLDAALKGTECMEMLDTVRQRVGILPIVVLGASMAPELRRAWRSRGAMECLAKPVGFRSLSAFADS